MNVAAILKEMEQFAAQGNEGAFHLATRLKMLYCNGAFHEDLLAFCAREGKVPRELLNRMISHLDAKLEVLVELVTKFPRIDAWRHFGLKQLLDDLWESNRLEAAEFRRTIERYKPSAPPKKGSVPNVRTEAPTVEAEAGGEARIRKIYSARMLSKDAEIKNLRERISELLAENRDLHLRIKRLESRNHELVGLKVKGVSPCAFTTTAITTGKPR